MNPFWWKKHVFSLQNHVILTKNGLIRVGLVSIKYLNKERQPLENVLKRRFLGP